MKNSKPQRSALVRKLVRRLSEERKISALKEGDVEKAKSEFKAARARFKIAKKAAKTARKKVKALKRELRLLRPKRATSNSVRPKKKVAPPQPVTLKRTPRMPDFPPKVRKRAPIPEASLPPVKHSDTVEEVLPSVLPAVDLTQKEPATH